MSSRFDKLASLPENLYTTGAPVIIAAGALLKDNQTGHVLVQLKFHSISDKVIKAIKVSVAAFDVYGKELPGVSEYQYLDLSAERDDLFGQKQAIPLPDEVTRSVQVSCTGVVFDDGSDWSAPADAQWEPLPQQERLSDVLGDLVCQYRRYTTNSAELLPADHGDLWLCACGQINHSGEERCCACKQEKAALLAALDRDTLAQHQADYDRAVAEAKAAQERKRQEEEAAQEKKRQEAKAALERRRQAEQARAKKTRKIVLISTAVVAAVVVVALLVTQVIIPTTRYNNAVSLMESGQYAEAAEAFDALGDYKDAIAKTADCQKKTAYQNAFTLMNEGKYVEAAGAFELLGNYEDAPAKRQDCLAQQKELDYQSAVSLMNDGKFAEAAEKFGTLGSYKDAEDQKAVCDKEVAYQQAASLTDQKKYDEAIAAWKELGEYKDATEWVKEVKYQKATACLEEKDYDSSNPIFEELGDYKDSSEKIHYHEYSITEEDPASCEKSGFRVYTCPGCGDSYEESVEAYGHNMSGVTCTSDSVCARCGMVGQKALGHTTSTGICSRCSADFRQTYSYSGTESYYVVDELYLNIPSNFFDGSYYIVVEGVFTTVNFFDESGHLQCGGFMTSGYRTFSGSGSLSYVHIENWDHNPWTITIYPA